jgi:hypothetical protein
MRAGDRDYTAALNIGIEYYAEEEARVQAGEETKASGRKPPRAAGAGRRLSVFRSDAFVYL